MIIQNPINGRSIYIQRPNDIKSVSITFEITDQNQVVGKCGDYIIPTVDCLSLLDPPDSESKSLLGAKPEPKPKPFWESLFSGWGNNDQCNCLIPSPCYLDRDHCTKCDKQI
jgi:hypothetical protein